MRRRPAIIRRIDAALAAMESREMIVRAIYLTRKDQALYDAAQSKAWGTPVACLSYGGIQIRRGEASKIYSTHGVSLAVPKQAPK